MGILNSLFSALLMYSRIPAPQVEWKEENRRYALCFFPLIGAVTGALLLAWLYLCNYLRVGDILFAAGAATIPLLITGGIHMDGFCDVIDAVSSYAPKEKKLQIMSDPHVGSFAVIGIVFYVLIQFALFTESRTEQTVLLIGLGYPLSRALSGIAAVTFRSAKKQGTLQDFAKPAHRQATIAVLVCIAVCLVIGMIAVGRGKGAVCAGAACLTFCWYRLFSYRVFEGITGDLAGFFLQICELVIVAAAVAGQWIGR